LIASGGLTSNVTINSGGTMVDELVVSNGQHIGYGPSLSGVALIAGGVLELLNPTVLSGGTLTVSAGAIIDGATVSFGGELIGPGEIGSNSTDYVYGSISGVALGDAVSGYDITELEAGGVASGVVLQNGRLYISAGATASKTLVTDDGGNLGGSYEDVSGLSVSAVVRGSGAAQYVESGGISDGATISSAGSAVVSLPSQRPRHRRRRLGRHRLWRPDRRHYDQQRRHPCLRAAG
jgi:autotransporter passenger strand-loop-strand repeat protein